VGVASVGDDPVMPDAYVLHQNVPNPFNARTTIRFSLDRADHVKVTVYNVLGQQIVTLMDEIKEANQHKVVWDGVDAYGLPAASGTYLYRLEIGDVFEETRRMTLLK
jgi:flagellar hook assembly protein FlgD